MLVHFVREDEESLPVGELDDVRDVLPGEDLARGANRKFSLINPLNRINGITL